MKKLMPLFFLLTFVACRSDTPSVAGDLSHAFSSANYEFRQAVWRAQAVQPRGGAEQQAAFRDAALAAVDDWTADAMSIFAAWTPEQTETAGLVDQYELSFVDYMDGAWDQFSQSTGVEDPEPTRQEITDGIHSRFADLRADLTAAGPI